MSVTGPRNGLEPQGTDRNPGALGGVMTLGACAGHLGSHHHCCNENFSRLWPPPHTHCLFGNGSFFSALAKNIPRQPTWQELLAVIHWETHFKSWPWNESISTCWNLKELNNHTYLVCVTVCALHLVNVNLNLPCCRHCARHGAYSSEQIHKIPPLLEFRTWQNLCLVVLCDEHRVGKRGGGNAAFQWGDQAASLSWQWSRGLKKILEQARLKHPGKKDLSAKALKQVFLVCSRINKTSVADGVRSCMRGLESEPQVKGHLLTTMPC